MIGLLAAMVRAFLVGFGAVTGIVLGLDFCGRVIKAANDGENKKRN